MHYAHASCAALVLSGGLPLAICAAPHSSIIPRLHCALLRVLQAGRQAGMGTNFALEVLKEADELGLRVRACVLINACMCTHACMLCVCGGVCGTAVVCLVLAADELGLRVRSWALCGA